MQKSALGHVVLAKLESHDSWEVVSQVGHQKSSSTALPRHKTIMLILVKPRVLNYGFSMPGAIEIEMTIKVNFEVSTSV